MSANSSTRNNGVDISTLSPLETLGDSVSKAFDPYGVTTSLLNAQMAWMLHPQELGRAAHALSGDLFALQSHLMRRALGMPSGDVIRPNADDARFAHPAWTNSATWDIIKEWYLAFTRRLEDMFFETPGLSDKERRRSAFWLRKWLNMVAPTNYFWLNPVAMQRFVETNGESVRKGWQNMLRDAKARNILMVEPDAFTVGKDLATTPGKVVFRNRLVELIHYAPTTERVRATPIVIITPWINKFYILDLTAKKSMVKYLTDQGFSVFITSWKNPGAEMADVRFDDYLLEGVNEVVRVAAEFCNVPQVHLVGYCIGGTLLSIGAAALARDGDQRPASMTMFAAQADFSEPGELAFFINPSQLAMLEATMHRKGVLESKQMGGAFALLRAKDLVWQPIVDTYLKGQRAPMIDLMAWNADGTRMPWRMHSEYLYRLYLDNELATNRFPVGGRLVRLSDIRLPMLVVGTEADHVAPWKSVYKIDNLVRSDDFTFLLTAGGHNAGIVCGPVHPKRHYRIRTRRLADPHLAPEEWMEAATRHDGSWWPALHGWLAKHSSGRTKPPAMGAPRKGYAVIEDAPGTYVKQR